MTVTVVATVGSDEANSYLTVAQGDAIANTMVATLKWGTATTAEKGRALITATRYLDQLEWIGAKASSTQALAWPRSGASCGDKDYSDDVIPSEIGYATFDLADALLNNTGLFSGSNAGLNELIPGIPNSDLRSARVDVLAVEFKETGGGAPAVRNALTVLPHLVGILGCLTTSSINSSVGRIAVMRS